MIWIVGEYAERTGREGSNVGRWWVVCSFSKSRKQKGQNTYYFPHFLPDTVFFCFGPKVSKSDHRIDNSSDLLESFLESFHEAGGPAGSERARLPEARRLKKR